MSNWKISTANTTSTHTTILVRGTDRAMTPTTDYSRADGLARRLRRGARLAYTGQSVDGFPLRFYRAPVNN